MKGGERDNFQKRFSDSRDEIYQGKIQTNPKGIRKMRQRKRVG